MMAKNKPQPAPEREGGDADVSPMEAQNAHQAHETVESPEAGVLTGAEPSDAGRHDEAPPKHEP